MFFEDRQWIVSNVAAPAALAELVTGPPQCLDAGFCLDGTLFLNDSAVADGPQVYAVIRDGVELDAIEFSACTVDEATDYIAGIVATATAEYPGAHVAVAVRVVRAAA